MNLPQQLYRGLPQALDLAENPVSVVDRWWTRKARAKWRKLSEYLEAGFWELAAQNYLRPPTRDSEKYAAQFRRSRPSPSSQVFGGWRRLMDTHFRDGGVFDQFTVKNPNLRM